MDEDLLFKTHNESKNPEIILKRSEKQKHVTFCQKYENGFNKEECSSLAKAFKSSQEKIIVKVLQNYDYKTNILSNITLENNISSSLLSNVCHYSFPSDCLFKIRRLHRCAVRNYKNENIFPTSRKMLILNDKCDSGFSSFMKNNSSDKIVYTSTLCDFQGPCLSNRQSNLKRKLDSDVVNELNLRLDNGSKTFSKSAIYTKTFDRTLSHSKHFKSDDSTQISDHINKHFVLQAQFINKMNSTENNNFKQMKNIEIQSSPVKIRVAANFGEDSIEYIDPTMEVELDSDESDPDEPGEQSNDAAEELHEHNQTADTNNEGNSESNGEVPEANISNIVNEDNSNEIKSECPDNLNVDNVKHNCIVEEQRLDPDSSKTIEDSQNALDKDAPENSCDELERKGETGSDNEKLVQMNESPPYLNNSHEIKMKPVNEETTTDILEFNEIENSCTTMDKNEDEIQNGKLSPKAKEDKISTSDANETEFFTKEFNPTRYEEFEKHSESDKTVEVSEVEKQTKTVENVEDSKLVENENSNELIKDVKKSNNDKENDNAEVTENAEIEEDEKTFDVVECMEVNEDDNVTLENKKNENDACNETKKNASEKEELEELKSEKIKELFDEQVNEIEENEENEIKENEENIIEEDIINNSSGNKTSTLIETLECFEGKENDCNEILQANGKEKSRCAKQFNESSEDNENINMEYNVTYKDEEEEKETAVDTEKSESTTDNISENEDIEVISDNVNGEVSLKETETFYEEKEHENVNKELNGIKEEQIEEKSEKIFENEEEQVNNLKSTKADEENFLQKQKLLDNLSHQTIENEEDSIEKDSIEDADNYQSTERRETESQDLCSNLEKHDFERKIHEIISNELRINTEDETTSENENISVQECNKKENTGVELDISAAKITENNIVSEEPEENFIEKEALNPNINESSDTTRKDIDMDENLNKESDKNLENDSKKAYETELDSGKVNESLIPDVSENVIIDSETVDKNISDDRKFSLTNEEVVDVEEKLSETQQDESNYPNIENVHSKKEKEMIVKDKKENDNDAAEYSSRGLLQSTKEQILINDDSVKICEEKAFDSSSMTMQDFSLSKCEQTICEKNSDQEVMRSPEKTKADKHEQSSADCAKVISPRKGIKVEEDEIETAISSIVFYDEMSDGNEQIVQTVASGVFSKPSYENDSITDENILPEVEDIKITVEDKADEFSSANVNENQLPLQAASADGELGSAETKTQPSTSPKKRKKKRKISRSRSAQKDGPSSATKRSQDSKASARTTRSVSSTSARSPSTGEKKLPPIKAPVGTTPPPNIKQVKSKIGSLDNVTHKPKGGDKKVEHVKLEWNAKSKVGSLDYATHKPGGGDKKILTQKLDFKNVQSKVGSKENLKHKPGGGNLKISTEKLDFKAKAASKVGSLENAKHKPGGGNVAIKSEKLHFKERAAPKIHSRSGSERGSSHGGSETQSPIMPSSPAPPEELPPLNEDENPSSQEEVGKQENSQEKVECNGGETTQDGENTQDVENTQDGETIQVTNEVPSNEASPSKPEDANSANDANNDNNANDANNAHEDQLIAF